MLNLVKGKPEDRLNTVVQHIAFQLHEATKAIEPGKMLITGGGAHNTFLVDQVRKQTIHDVTIPEREIVDFKEAIIFGFLGVLRMNNEVNCLASVTGAKSDSCSGVVFYP